MADGAKVLAFKRSVDPDRPFRKLDDAGLVNVRFGIDGQEPSFWGYHRPGESWNGWDMPRFGREVAWLITDWIHEGDSLTLRWEGEQLYVRDNDEGHEDLAGPDELGLYRFDGWTWLALQ